VRSFEVISTVLTAALCAAVIAGCGSSEYARTRDAWTDSAKAHANFETLAILRGTLHTPEFRRAYADEYARVYALDDAGKASLIAAGDEDARSRIRVTASFHTLEHRWNSLNPADGFWEVRLEGANGDVSRPVSVRRLDTNNPLWARLFPYHDTFSVLYELDFERTGQRGSDLLAGGWPMTLVVAGPPGTLRLEWEP
jgi:hypothetical protein